MELGNSLSRVYFGFSRTAGVSEGLDSDVLAVAVVDDRRIGDAWFLDVNSLHCMAERALKGRSGNAIRVPYFVAKDF